MLGQVISGTAPSQVGAEFCNEFLKWGIIPIVCID